MCASSFKSIANAKIQQAAHSYFNVSFLLFYREKMMHSSLKQRKENQLVMNPKTIPIPVLNSRPQRKIQTAATAVKTSPVMKIATPRMTRATLRYQVLILL